MFDKTILVQQPSQPSHTTKTVNINRQSTTEDAKLLSDLEKEALAKVKNVLLHNITGLDMEFITYQYEQNYLDQKHVTYIAFIINGERFHIKVEDGDLQDTDPNKWVRIFYEALAKEIANTLITHHNVVGERAAQNKQNGITNGL